MVKKYTPWVTPLKNGKFRVSQKYVDPLRSVPGKLHLRKVSVTINKNTAQARNLAFAELDKKIDKVVAEQSKGTDITFKDLSDKYQEYLKVTNRAWNTRRIAFYNLKQINQYFDGLIAKKLTTPMVNKYLAHLLYYRKPKGYSNSQVRTRKTIISNVYNFGMDQGYVSSNPTHGVRVQWRDENNKKRDRIQNKFLTDTELRALLGYVKYVDGRTYYYYLFRLMAETGMRFSEAAGLKKNDLHISKAGSYLRVVGNQEFHYGQIADAFDEKKGGTKSDHTKSPAGFRKVIISYELAKMLNSLNYNSDYLLINEISRHPFNASSVNKYLEKMSHKLGIDKKLSTHYFRHTYISKLAEKHIPLNLIMQQVGQDDSDVTKQIYTHVTENEFNDLHQNLANMTRDFKV